MEKWKLKKFTKRQMFKIISNRIKKIEEYELEDIRRRLYFLNKVLKYLKSPNVDIVDYNIMEEKALEGVETYRAVISWDLIADLEESIEKSKGARE